MTWNEMDCLIIRPCASQLVLRLYNDSEEREERQFFSPATMSSNLSFWQELFSHSFGLLQSILNNSYSLYKDAFCSSSDHSSSFFGRRRSQLPRYVVHLTYYQIRIGYVRLDVGSSYCLLSRCSYSWSHFSFPKSYGQSCNQILSKYYSL